MSEFEVWVPVEIGRAREVVWDALTTSDIFLRWWGTDELVEVEPGFETGATLRFASGWSPTIDECLPLETLAFARHRFDLSDAGDSLTKLEWSQWVKGNPALDQLGGIDTAGPFRQRMTVALDKFKKIVEMEHVLVQAAVEETPLLDTAAPAADLERADRHVRVFVSSTFADMAADRDELVGRSFLELRRLCQERGVIFSEVDLRWGITDEQQAKGQVLPICLAEIDRCRPYFIGLLGERYGSDLEHIPEELISQQTWLAEHRHKSVTELEILHGVLNNPEMAEHAFFYFRDPDYVNAQSEKEQARFREGPTENQIAELGLEEAKRRAEDRSRRLQELKEAIRNRFDVRAYSDPQQLAGLVVEDLTGVIDQRFPEGSAPDLDQREATRQAGFTAELRSVFIDRPEMFRALDDHVNSSGPPLVVMGESGTGKSALLANWVMDHQSREDKIPVLSHFVSASGRSSELSTLIHMLLVQMIQTHGLVIDIPDEMEALKRTFASALLTFAKSGPFVVVIDGADDITGLSLEAPLSWIPHKIPPQARIIVSTSPGPTLDDALRRSWSRLEIPKLDPGERERLITSYLDRYAKSLSKDHLARIIAHQHSTTPRFLAVLLDELRWEGDYATLGDTLDGYLSAADITELYGSALDRCEDHYGQDRPGLVKDAVSYLWAAREGLTESELRELLGDGDEWLPQALWSPLELAAEAVIISRSGHLSLRNTQVRRTVEMKYLNTPEKRRRAHLHMAAYFSGSQHKQRRAIELPWQLVRAEEWAELFDVLADEGMLIEIWNENPWDLRQYWAEITRHTERSMVDGYRGIIDQPDKHPYSAGLVAQLLVQGGYLYEALPLSEYLVDQARGDGDAGRMIVALNNLSPILAAQGDLEARMECAKELEAVARQVGDRMGIAGALASRAGVHVVRGEYEEAVSLYQEEQGIRSKLGDRDGLQYCLGNQAQILVDQSELDEALNLRQEQERLSREIGNLHGLRIALGTQAVIHRMWGKYEKAIQLHSEEERICRENGDMTGLQASLGNQALINQLQGDLEKAIEMFQEQERICREQGILQDLSTSLNNQAGILVQKADLAGAARLYQEQEGICRQLGYDLGLQAALGNQGLLRMHLDDIKGAVELFRKQEQICRRRGFHEYLAHCLNNLIMPLQILGQQEEADAVRSEVLELVERYGLNAQH